LAVAVASAYLAVPDDPRETGPTKTLDSRIQDSIPAAQ